MSNKHDLELKVEYLQSPVTEEKVRHLLYKLTDEDFNGNNGDEYYTAVSVMGRTTRISRLDALMLFYNNYENPVTFIKSVLEQCYADDYYNEYKCEVLSVHDVIVAIVSYC